jgi:hypothetical protein
MLLLYRLRCRAQLLLLSLLCSLLLLVLLYELAHAVTEQHALAAALIVAGVQRPEALPAPR